MPEYDLNIAVFDGGSDDLLLLDFSFINLRFFRIESDEFKSMLNGIVGDYEETPSGFQIRGQHFADSQYSHLIYSQPGGYRQHLYALVPVDPKLFVERRVFEDVERMLLIMFPCGIQLTDLIQYEKTESGYYIESLFAHWDYMTHWYFKDNWTPEGNVFRMDKMRLAEINAFLPRCYEWLIRDNDFKLAIDSYIDGFTQRDVKMAFVLFCISLESITKAHSEIVHRISRVCAVVCSDTKEDGRIIFNNTKILYELRSKIVHGDVAKGITGYLFNLIAISSRTITEIISLNINSREILNNFVIESGYGDKAIFNSSYLNPKFNTELMNLIVEKLPRPK